MFSLLPSGPCAHLSLRVLHFLLFHSRLQCIHRQSLLSNANNRSSRRFRKYPQRRLLLGVPAVLAVLYLLVFCAGSTRTRSDLDRLGFSGIRLLACLFNTRNYCCDTFTRLIARETLEEGVLARFATWIGGFRSVAGKFLLFFVLSSIRCSFSLVLSMVILGGMSAPGRAWTKS